MILNRVASIAASAMTAAETRLGVAADNIVNSASAGTEETAFRPRRAIPQAVPGGGVRVDIRPVDPPFQRVFSPDSPDADAGGLLSVPNISLVQESVNIIAAEAAFKAGAALLARSDELSGRLLDILDSDSA